MTRTLRHILTLAALLCCAALCRAQDIEANGIFYNIINDTQVEVTSAFYKGENHYTGCIILPERVHCNGVNYDVAAIAPRAFWRSHVTEVQIPNSITVIGEAAFADAEDLTSITLPLGLTHVSRYMLAGTAVSTVVLPEQVTDIDEGAFEDCAMLHTVFLPMRLQTIGKRAFGYCVNLAEIYSDAAQPPLLLGDDVFEGTNGIQVMLPQESITRQYEDDPQWGDEETFSLWIDEGLATRPFMEQEVLGGQWTAITLGNHLAYKIYGPDGYLKALTAADRYFLPIGASSDEYVVVPTTLMYDEEDFEMVATTAMPATIDELEPKPEDDVIISSVNGTLHIEGNTLGLWTTIYDVYGNLWYHRPVVCNWMTLPGQRVYIVRVGDVVRKVLLN